MPLSGLIGCGGFRTGRREENGQALCEDAEPEEGKLPRRERGKVRVQAGRRLIRDEAGGVAAGGDGNLHPAQSGEQLFR